MKSYKEVFETLQGLGIQYEIVEHPAALTTEEADRYIEGKVGVRTKTMFLCDKKKRQWILAIMDDMKRLDMKEFGERIDVKGMKMASEDSLAAKMMLPPGTVSPFGLLNNVDKDIQVYIDEEIINEEIMTFHPNINTMTLFLKTTDLLKFLESQGYQAIIMKL